MVFIGLYKLQGVPVDEVGGIDAVAPAAGHVFWQLDLLGIGPEMVGVVIMCKGLTVIAIEIGETFFVGGAGGAGVAQAPFAEIAGDIAVALQDGGDGQAGIRERE